MEKYFTLTRDYGIITDNPYHVAQIVEVFNADWEHLDWDCSAYEGLAVEQFQFPLSHGAIHRHGHRTP